MTEILRTIGEVAGRGMLLRVECLGCGHVGHHKPALLMRAVGPARELDALPLVCSRCGGRKARAVPIPLDHDRPPRVTVWVPMPLRR